MRTLLFGCVVLMVGCVQPFDESLGLNSQVIDKSELGGVWHYRVEPGGALLSSEPQCLGALEGLVRWEIQQDYLLARLVAPVSGGTLGDAGPIVGAWEIRHFDVSTRTMGQWCADGRCCVEGWCCACNLIWQADDLRPWWVRQYIRVEWDKNLAVGEELQRLTEHPAAVEPIAPVPGQLVVARGADWELNSITVASRALAMSVDCPETPTVVSFAQQQEPECVLPWSLGCEPVDLTLGQTFYSPAGYGSMTPASTATR